MYKRILFIPHRGMGKEDKNMEKEKYYLIYTDDESIEYYVEDNSIEGYLAIDGNDVRFEADDYLLEINNADIDRDEDDNIIVNTGMNYYTFSENDIESIE